jgi:hypothetical protein
VAACGYNTGTVSECKHNRQTCRPQAPAVWHHCSRRRPVKCVLTTAAYQNGRCPGRHQRHHKQCTALACLCRSCQMMHHLHSNSPYRSSSSSNACVTDIDGLVGARSCCPVGRSCEMRSTCTCSYVHAEL